jgi:hypothetical protein
MAGLVCALYLVLSFALGALGVVLIYLLPSGRRARCDTSPSPARDDLSRPQPAQEQP